MRRILVMLLVLAMVILGVVGIASAAHDEIVPFSVLVTKSGR
ncbi:MAG TPA: hypothetical protein VGK74_10685 [Symbiobacteriaceae bacterium]|jgi:uncharacterized membrane protein YciS (DUF1049 family)